MSGKVKVRSHVRNINRRQVWRVTDKKGRLWEFSGSGKPIWEMNDANKSTNPDVVYKELMKHKSFRESTPRTREDKLKRAINRRRNR